MFPPIHCQFARWIKMPVLPACLCLCPFFQISFKGSSSRVPPILSGVQNEHSLWISSLNLARSLPWLWTCPIALSKALALGEGELLLCVVSCGCRIWSCSFAMGEGVVQSTGKTLEEKEEKETDSLLLTFLMPCLLLSFRPFSCLLKMLAAIFTANRNAIR